MIKSAAIALVLTAVATAASAAPALDAAGKCRDAGKFVAASMCKAPAMAATSGKCRDIKTKKFAKCGAPGAESMPKK
jgi:hypothetical protein